MPLLEACMNNPITKEADVYLMVADIYQRKSNSIKWNETITAGKKAFPNNTNFLREEINYYIVNDKKEELLVKLNEAIITEPKRADLHFNLGVIYDKMANPTDKSGNKLTKPANASDQVSKALNCYTKAIELEPTNPDYQLNTAVLHYNQASDVTDEMNKLTTSAIDTKKYDELKKKRDEFFGKAVPYFEKAETLYASKTNDENAKSLFRSVLTGLREIYAKTNNITKSEEYKRKIDILK